MLTDEQIRTARVRMRQAQEQMLYAAMLGHPAGTFVNEAGNIEKPVEGRRVDNDASLARQIQTRVHA